MIDEHDIRDMLNRRATSLSTISVDSVRATRRARRRLAVNGAITVIAAAALTVATLSGIDSIRTAPIPGGERPPGPVEGILRANGDVLSFGGVSFGGRPYDRTADLGAVNPETGEERVLVPDLHGVISAEWSADGRWVAYQRDNGSGRELWVVGAAGEPRLITTGADPNLFPDGSVGWTWSASGAELLTVRRSGGTATVDRSQLTAVDVTTGTTTDLGSVDGDAGIDPAWSPDGTRIAFASRDATVYSFDLSTRERSLIVRLPDLDPYPRIEWSPDGAHIAIVDDMGDAGERLFLVDADGSNVRTLSEGYELLLAAWSPDGSQLAFAQAFRASGEIAVLVTAPDASEPAEIGRVSFVGCAYNYMCGLTWSPDGSTLGFHKDEGEDAAIAADGSGEPVPIDDVTYMSWAGGRYGED